MQRRYATADVFTDRLFGGNPIAVVLDAAGLSSAQMQAIASEFNYSETTFVLGPDDPAHSAKVRIFTPRAEIPFAGHPNVGTAFLLARAASAREEPVPDRYLFEEAAGLVEVRLLRNDGEVVGAELTAPQPLARLAAVPVERAAACLTLPVADVRTNVHLPQVVSVGLPFLVVELSSRDALRRARPNLAAHAELFPLNGADAVYAYTRDVGLDGWEARLDLQARMFSPLDGIVEDPATGSATAAAAALIAAQESLASEKTFRVGQGIDMGRPSLLLARVSRRDGATALTVHVGGGCVAVMDGTIRVASCEQTQRP